MCRKAFASFLFLLAAGVRLPAQNGLRSDPVCACREARALLGDAPAPAGPARLVTGQRQLFLDNAGLERMEGITRNLHSPVKRGAVIRPDRPSENGSIQIRTGPSWNPDKKLWMMWYGNGHAVSPDGLQWTKPAEQNTASAPVTPYTILYDRSEADPRRRYKGLVPGGAMHLRTGGFYPALSPDGRNWEVLKAAFIPSSDEWHLFHDDERQLYVATVKHLGPYGRSVYLSLSRDYEHWTDPRDCLIFHADRRDQELGAARIRFQAQSEDLRKPVVDRPEEYNTDIYNLPVFRYEGIYIGMPTVYNACGRVFDNSDGFSMAELAVSRDLIAWERVGNRQKFLPLSRLENGRNYDTGQLLAANYPIVKAEEIWFYYTGLRWRVHPDALTRSTKGPNGWEFYSPGDSGAICLATLRRDGFVSLDAGATQGYVLTKPLVLSGRTLHGNAAAGDGEVRAELIDAATEQVLAGFSSAQCAPVRGDRLDAEFTWTGGRSAVLPEKSVRIRFVLRHAGLYAFWTK